MGKGLSITAFILSILFFIPLAPLIGLILGIVAVVKAKDDSSALKGLAIAAIVIGAILLIPNLLISGGFIIGILLGSSKVELSLYDYSSDINFNDPTIMESGFNIDAVDLPNIYSTDLPFNCTLGSGYMLFKSSKRVSVRLLPMGAIGTTIDDGKNHYDWIRRPDGTPQSQYVAESSPYPKTGMKRGKVILVCRKSNFGNEVFNVPTDIQFKDFR
jgi:hypothetical protein